MQQWIVMHRDESGTIHRVEGLWEADSATDAVARMLSSTGRSDDGAWEAEEPHERHDMMKWHLDNESKGKPKPSR